jgi:hypothetical protein
MTAPSPWLDVHRSSRPPRSHGAESDEETDDSESESETETESADGTTASKTNPWDDIEPARRPSQSAVDLPSPDQQAGD